MKVVYYTYWLVNRTNDQIYHFDLKDILSRLQTESLEFKQGFIDGDNDHMYLVQENQQFANTYLFMLTRDSEIIKAIDENLDIEDIADKIAKDERIVTCSFVYLGQKCGYNFIGLASQVLSPKIERFGRYVNMYLKKLGLSNDYEIHFQPVVVKSTVNELMEMEIISRANIEINHENRLFQDIVEFFGGTVDSMRTIKSLKISLQANRGKNIKESLTRLPNIANDEGIVKLTARAKAELEDQLMNVYVVGQGVVGDEIYPSTNSVNIITEKIISAWHDNDILGEKLMDIWVHNANSGDIPDDIRNILLGNR